MQMRHNDEALVQLTDTADAVPKLCGLLELARPRDVVEHSAILLNLLITRPDTKVKAVKQGAIHRLLELLKLGSLPLKQAVLATTGNITIANEGKKAVVEESQLTNLLRHVACPNRHIRSFALQCVNNIAEDPAGRTRLNELGLPALLKGMLQSADGDDVKEGIAQAIRQLAFTTRPYSNLSPIEQSVRRVDNSTGEEDAHKIRQEIEEWRHRR